MEFPNAKTVPSTSVQWLYERCQKDQAFIHEERIQLQEQVDVLRRRIDELDQMYKVVGASLSAAEEFIPQTEPTPMPLAPHDKWS